MVWMVVGLASTLGGAIGWKLGMFGGMGLAFFFSLIGTAVGVFFARRFVSRYLS